MSPLTLLGGEAQHLAERHGGGNIPNIVSVKFSLFFLEYTKELI